MAHNIVTPQYMPPYVLRIGFELFVALASSLSHPCEFHVFVFHQIFRAKNFRIHDRVSTTLACDISSDFAVDDRQVKER